MADAADLLFVIIYVYIMHFLKFICLSYIIVYNNQGQILSMMEMRFTSQATLWKQRGDFGGFHSLINTSRPKQKGWHFTWGFIARPKVNIDLGNSVAPNWQKAIIWNNEYLMTTQLTDIICWLSGKLWYLQHNCVGDTIVYHWDSDIYVSPGISVLIQTVQHGQPQLSELWVWIQYRNVLPV